MQTLVNLLVLLCYIRGCQGVWIHIAGGAEQPAVVTRQEGQLTGDTIPAASAMAAFCMFSNRNSTIIGFQVRMKCHYYLVAIAAWLHQQVH